MADSQQRVQQILEQAIDRRRGQIDIGKLIPLMEQAFDQAWYPIVTAPRDGTRIVLWMGFVWQTAVVGRWVNANPVTGNYTAGWETADGMYDLDVALWWLPLPVEQVEHKEEIHG